MPSPKKSYCLRGHPRTPENIRGNYTCRLCKYKYPKNSRRYYLKYRKKVIARSKTWAQRNPERTAYVVRRALLKRNYGLTIENYEEMLCSQGGVCAVCGRPPLDRRLAVDHNHKSGRIRGLLCNGRVGCNYVLGLLERNKFVLAAAGKFAEYVASEGRWPWIVPDKKKHRKKKRPKVKQQEQ